MMTWSRERAQLNWRESCQKYAFDQASVSGTPLASNWWSVFLVFKTVPPFTIALQLQPVPQLSPFQSLQFSILILNSLELWGMKWYQWFQLYLGRLVGTPRSHSRQFLPIRDTWCVMGSCGVITFVADVSISAEGGDICHVAAQLGCGRFEHSCRVLANILPIGQGKASAFVTTDVHVQTAVAFVLHSVRLCSFTSTITIDLCHCM